MKLLTKTALSLAFVGAIAGTYFLSNTKEEPLTEGEREFAIIMTKGLPQKVSFFSTDQKCTEIFCCSVQNGDPVCEDINQEGAPQKDTESFHCSVQNGEPICTNL